MASQENSWEYPADLSSQPLADGQVPIPPQGPSVLGSIPAGARRPAQGRAPLAKRKRTIGQSSASAGPLGRPADLSQSSSGSGGTLAPTPLSGNLSGDVTGAESEAERRDAASGAQGRRQAAAESADLVASHARGLQSLSVGPQGVGGGDSDDEDARFALSQVSLDLVAAATSSVIIPETDSEEEEEVDNGDAKEDENPAPLRDPAGARGTDPPGSDPPPPAAAGRANVAEGSEPPPDRRPSGQRSNAELIKVPEPPEGIEAHFWSIWDQRTEDLRGRYRDGVQATFMKAVDNDFVCCRTPQPLSGRLPDRMAWKVCRHAGTIAPVPAFRNFGVLAVCDLFDNIIKPKTSEISTAELLSKKSSLHAVRALAITECPLVADKATSQALKGFLDSANAAVARTLSVWIEPFVPAWKKVGKIQLPDGAGTLRETQEMGDLVNPVLALYGALARRELLNAWRKASAERLATVILFLEGVFKMCPKALREKACEQILIVARANHEALEVELELTVRRCTKGLAKREPIAQLAFKEVNSVDRQSATTRRLIESLRQVMDSGPRSPSLKAEDGSSNSLTHPVTQPKLAGKDAKDKRIRKEKQQKKTGDVKPPAAGSAGKKKNKRRDGKAVAPKAAGSQKPAGSAARGQGGGRGRGKKRGGVRNVGQPRPKG